MTELDALLDNASDNTAGVFSLSGETLAVLFFALSQVQNIDVWRDFPDEPLTDEQIDQITELVDWANDELMREAAVTPVGTIAMWTVPTLPENWLPCDGGAYLKADYPELFAVLGDRYGETETLFGVPDMTFRSPFGASIESELDLEQGELEHTLTIGEMPAHGHNIKIGTVAGSGAHPHANLNQANQSTSYAAIADAGGGGSHNNLHPVYGVYYIVYAGKAAA